MIAVLDACVLYPPSLRDLLMWVATAEAYEPRFTEEIHAEWIRNVLADNKHVTREQLDRTCRLMNQCRPLCLVSGYESRIPTISLPDMNDRHVLATALESGAELIVTFNLTDFPDEILKIHRVRAVHPDAFLCAILANLPTRLLQGVKAHRASLTNPPKSVSEYIVTIKANGLSEFAYALERLTGSI